jgi:hypothetical protein
VTRILAIETKRMADVAAHPQVVANIVPNQWSTIHFDINVTNTGNATAYDIEVRFDPPLTSGEARESQPIPFQKISVLKPGQSMTSYLSGVGDYLEKSFEVAVTWKLSPGAAVSDGLTYTLNMADYQGVSYLGVRDPLVQLAEQVKNLREDWRYVASGSKRLKAETFDASDRKSERDALEERFKRNKSKARSNE